MTPQQMASCAEGGRFWYMRPDGSFYGIPERVESEDTYLLDASPEWVAQWSNWDEAAEVMTPLFDRLNEIQN